MHDVRRLNWLFLTDLTFRDQCIQQETGLEYHTTRLLVTLGSFCWLLCCPRTTQAKDMSEGGSHDHLELLPIFILVAPTTSSLKSAQFEQRLRTLSGSRALPLLGV